MITDMPTKDDFYTMADHMTGESCQASNQDSPPNIPTARKRLQINAAKMKANAVLLHSCEVTSGTPGCYRQAVCLGSALNVSAQ